MGIFSVSFSLKRQKTENALKARARSQKERKKERKKEMTAATTTTTTMKSIPARGSLQAGRAQTTLLDRVGDDGGNVIEDV